MIMKMMTLNGSMPASALSFSPQTYRGDVVLGGRQGRVEPDLDQAGGDKDAASISPGMTPAINSEAIETSAKVPTMIARHARRDDRREDRAAQNGADREPEIVVALEHGRQTATGPSWRRPRSTSPRARRARSRARSIRTYCRPRIRPTSLSIDVISTSMHPDRNRISPSKMNSGTVPSAAVVDELVDAVDDHAEGGVAERDRDARDDHDQEGEEDRRPRHEQHDEDREAGRQN